MAPRLTCINTKPLLVNGRKVEKRPFIRKLGALFQILSIEIEEFCR